MDIRIPRICSTSPDNLNNPFKKVKYHSSSSNILARENKHHLVLLTGQVEYKRRFKEMVETEGRLGEEERV